MDVVLGVAVTGPVARLALLGSAATGQGVIDQSVVDVAGDTTEMLTETVTGTHRLLAQGNHRLAATRLCWSDEAQASRLRQALLDSGLADVTVLSQADAATALIRGTGGAELHGDSALLLVDDDAATLTIVGADAATTSVIAVEPVAGSDPVTACNSLLDRLREEPGAAQNLYLIGTSADVNGYADRLRAASPLPLDVPDEPSFALARGAAMAVTSYQPAVSAAQNTVMAPQLAYSMADDSGPLPMEYGDYGSAELPLQTPMAPLSATAESEEEGSAPSAARPPMLLVGSAIAGLVVVGFAAVAVTVAISFRPLAAETARPATVPEVYYPPLPAEDWKQEQAPALPSPPPAEPVSASGGGGQISTGGGGGGRRESAPIIINNPVPGPPNSGPQQAPAGSGFDLSGLPPININLDGLLKGIQASAGTRSNVPTNGTAQIKTSTGDESKDTKDTGENSGNTGEQPGSGSTETDATEGAEGGGPSGGTAGAGDQTPSQPEDQIQQSESGESSDSEPLKPLAPRPADPVVPEAVDPVVPEPLKPLAPRPADPVVPEAVDPVVPQPPKPLAPKPAEPVVPKAADPVVPEPPKPVYTEPEPVVPEPPKPVYTEPEPVYQPPAPVVTAPEPAYVAPEPVAPAPAPIISLPDLSGFGSGSGSSSGGSSSSGSSSSGSSSSGSSDSSAATEPVLPGLFNPFG